MPANDAAFTNQAVPVNVAADPYLPDSVKQQIASSGGLYADIAGTNGAAKNPLRSELTQITAIVGNTVYFKDSTHFNMSASDTTVQKMNTVDNLDGRRLHDPGQHARDRSVVVHQRQP